MTTTAEPNALSHNPEVFKRTFWLHKNPNPTNGFGEIWKTRTEPIYSKSKHGYTFTRDGILDDDRMVHLNVNTCAVLPKELHKLVTPGKKVKVNVECTYEIKDIDDPCEEPGARTIYTENMNEPFKILRCTDRMLFALEDNDDIYERIGVIYSVTNNPDHPIKEEYINEYGHIVHHADNKEAKDCYTIFGRVGDTITPKTLGDFYLNLEEPHQSFELFLTKAYKQGLRFAEPPSEDNIPLVIKELEEGILSVECCNDFYSFGKPIILDANDLPECKRQITKGLVGGLVAYRWLYNNPDLDFDSEFNDPPQPSLSGKYDNIDKIMNEAIAEKWSRRVSRGASFAPIRT